MERELFGQLIAALDRIPGVDRRAPKCTYRDRDILAVLLWAALHDRPVSWAVHRSNWPFHDRVRPLPSSATISRRARRTEIAAHLERLIRVLHVGRETARELSIDGRPLATARHSADRDAAHGRAAGGLGKGYKLHQIVDSVGNCRAFEVLPLNVNEQKAAFVLIGRLEPGEGDTLLGDNAYDANTLYECAGLKGIQLLAPRRASAAALGHHAHSAWRLKCIGLLAARPELLDGRRWIESCFGTQGNVVGGLGPLPNFVRGLLRVRLWVAAKLAIDAAHRQRRWRRKHHEHAA
jgi:hypothetical protein